MRKEYYHPEMPDPDDIYTILPELGPEDLQPLPRGYNVTNYDGEALLVSNGKNDFYLTDRSIKQLDYYLHGKLFHHVEQLIESRDDTSAPIKILDLACGVRSLAADELQTKYGDDVEVHAIDFILAKESARAPDVKKAMVTQADILEGIPHKDNSFHFSFSWQFLPKMWPEHYTTENPEIFAQYIDCVLDIGRVIMPGFEGWFDDNVLSRWSHIPFNHPLFARFSDKGINVTSKYAEQNLDGSMHTQGGFGTPFLVLKKW